MSLSRTVFLFPILAVLIGCSTTEPEPIGNPMMPISTPHPALSTPGAYWAQYDPTPTRVRPTATPNVPLVNELQMSRLYRELAFCLATFIRNNNPHTDAFKTYDEMLTMFDEAHREEIQANRGNPAGSRAWLAKVQADVTECKQDGGY